MAASSPYASAPVMVKKPVSSHAASSSAGESTSRAISADTMKMPEPIIEPITMVVALMGPIPLTNSVSLEATERGVVSVAKEFGSGVRISLFYWGGRIRQCSALYDSAFGYRLVLLVSSRRRSSSDCAVVLAYVVSASSGKYWQYM